MTGRGAATQTPSACALEESVWYVFTKAMRKHKPRHDIVICDWYSFSILFKQIFLIAKV